MKFPLTPACLASFFRYYASSSGRATRAACAVGQLELPMRHWKLARFNKHPNSAECRLTRKNARFAKTDGKPFQFQTQLQKTCGLPGALVGPASRQNRASGQLGLPTTGRSAKGESGSVPQSSTPRRIEFSSYSSTLMVQPHTAHTSRVEQVWQDYQIGTQTHPFTFNIRNTAGVHPSNPTP